MAMRTSSFAATAISWVLFAALGGCGPMNEELNKKGNADEQRATPINGDQRASRTGRYLTHVFVSGAEDKPVSSVQVGEVVFNVRLLQNSTLTPVSGQTKVTFISEMPSMPEMGLTPDEAQRQPDGTYSAMLIMGHAGDWRITVQIEDEGQKDEYVFDIVVVK